VSTPKLIDAHTHVQFAAFKDDADAVIGRAFDQGVWMINVGTQRDTSEKAISLAGKYPEGVYATVGLHPIHTEQSFHDAKELGDSSEAKGFTSRGEEFDFEFYKKLAMHPKVVGIGECGLDYYRIKNQESRIKQENVFRQQIELAKEARKPLMIHCRSAFGDLIKILNSCFLIRDSQSPGAVHFFSGTKNDTKKLLDLGFSFSFGGVITFTRDYDELIRYIPFDRMLLETDAPYVTPVPYRGKRNEPAYVVEVAKKIAELKNIGFEEVAATTFQNVCNIFKI